MLYEVHSLVYCLVDSEQSSPIQTIHFQVSFTRFKKYLMCIPILILFLLFMNLYILNFMQNTGNFFTNILLDLQKEGFKHCEQTKEWLTRWSQLNWMLHKICYCRFLHKWFPIYHTITVTNVNKKVNKYSKNITSIDSSLSQKHHLNTKYPMH